MTPEGITPKVTIPSPSLIIKRDHRSDLYADYYDSWTDFLDALTDFLDALAKAYHDTIQHFYDLGARYVRLDDTTWGYLIQQFENEKIILRKQLSWQKLLRVMYTLLIKLWKVFQKI